MELKNGNSKLGPLLNSLKGKNKPKQPSPKLKNINLEVRLRYMTVILALRRLEQEDFKFEVSLGYIASFTPV
jgi:hypothetical protein